jgi:hypothetical protein
VLLEGLELKAVAKRKTCVMFEVLLATCFTLVSCFTYSSIQKIEARISSETSVDFHRTTRRYIVEDIS